MGHTQQTAHGRVARHLTHAPASLHALALLFSLPFLFTPCSFSFFHGSPQTICTPVLHIHRDRCSAVPAPLCLVPLLPDAPFSALSPCRTGVLAVRLPSLSASASPSSSQCAAAMLHPLGTRWLDSSHSCCIGSCPRITRRLLNQRRNFVFHLYSLSPPIGVLALWAFFLRDIRALLSRFLSPACATGGEVVNSR